jgi:hypothetical protein
VRLAPAGAVFYRGVLMNFTKLHRGVVLATQFAGAVTIATAPARGSESPERAIEVVELGW